MEGVPFSMEGICKLKVTFLPKMAYIKRERAWTSRQSFVGYPSDLSKGLYFIKNKGRLLAMRTQYRPVQRNLYYV